MKMASTRRTSTDRGHNVENGKRATHSVGSDPPRDVSRAARRARGGRPAARRSGLLRAVRGALPCGVGSPLGPDRDLPAAHVLEVPLPTRVRAAVPGSGRLDLLAAVLPDPPRPGAPAPDHP